MREGIRKEVGYTKTRMFQKSTKISPILVATCVEVKTDLRGPGLGKQSVSSSSLEDDETRLILLLHIRL